MDDDRRLFLILIMGYLVSRYKRLFPLGTFDAPETLKTWSQSHRLFAQNQVKDMEVREILAPGLVLSKGHINFRRGGFSNYQCWEIDLRKRKTHVVFFNEGEFPVRAFEKTPNLRLLATLGYFYFTTNPKVDEISPPKIKVNNLFVQNGQLFQLPVVDRSALIIFKDGRVEIPFIQAEGTLKIGQRKFKWRGVKTLKKDKSKEEPVVYNGSAGIIEPYEDPVIGPGRLAKKVLTPPKGLDLVLSLRDKKLQVTDIRNGSTEVTRGLWILSGQKDLLKGIKKGEFLKEIAINGLKVGDILDAVSVGPRILQDQKKRQRQLEEEGLDNDQSLCNRSHREGLKLARAFLVKLKNGNLVSILIDGIPQADDIYPGVTPQEAADFIFEKYPQVQEVVATDPGGTMKAVYKDKNGKIQVFGNLHYLDYRYRKDGTVDFWPNGYFGRRAVTFLGVS